jgi:16S rRNA (cytosine967-C5)-methyltransferase
MKTWGNITRKLGVEIAEPLTCDATKTSCYPDVEADLIFIDPPCTGTGLFIRHPSSKWRVSRRSIRRMADIQNRILETSSQFLKSGGTLVYGTCSVTLEENERLIMDFLDQNPEYETTPMTPFIGCKGLEGMENAQRLYPDLHDCNGFFIVKLVKH